MMSHDVVSRVPVMYYEADFLLQNRGSALPSSTPQQTTPQQLNREQQGEEWEEEEIVEQHQPDTLHHVCGCKSLPLLTFEANLRNHVS